MTKPIIYAHQIVQQLEQSIQNDDTWTFDVPVDCKTKSVVEAVRILIKEREWNRRVTMFQALDKVVVVVKAHTYTQKLEGMVRKLALHVDDDRLYDEAMTLLGMEV